jgi:DNA-directed RNA polymerase alpha subunit
MNPKINKRNDSDGIFTFTLQGVDVSFANALRRTILSDIETVVFKTTPYSENKSKFIVNTSRLNNEIIKQRLSCIPIHIKDINIPLNNYIVELNVKNSTDTILDVTTKDFKIKDINTNKYLDENKTKEIFKPFVPSDKDEEYFIHLVSLRPKISEEIEGEHLHLTCEFSLGKAKDDGMFNVASTCSYGNTPDLELMNEELEKKKQKWKDQSLTKEDIDYEIKNWQLLEGLRYFKKNSYDFIIETIGVFDNNTILFKACDVILQKINTLEKLIDDDTIKIIPSKNTMNHCYDIVLENEDYTIGLLLRFVLFTKFYEENKILNFCGFKKEHPHNKDSLIRLAYVEQTDKSGIKTNLKTANNIILELFTKLKENFV